MRPDRLKPREGTYDRKLYIRHVLSKSTSTQFLDTAIDEDAPILGDDIESQIGIERKIILQLLSVYLSSNPRADSQNDVSL